MDFDNNVLVIPAKPKPIKIYFEKPTVTFTAINSYFNRNLFMELFYRPTDPYGLEYYYNLFHEWAYEEFN